MNNYFLFLLLFIPSQILFSGKAGYQKLKDNKNFFASEIAQVFLGARHLLHYINLNDEKVSQVLKYDLMDNTELYELILTDEQNKITSFQIAKNLKSDGFFLLPEYRLTVDAKIIDKEKYINREDENLFLTNLSESQDFYHVDLSEDSVEKKNTISFEDFFQVMLLLKEQLLCCNLSENPLILRVSGRTKKHKIIYSIEGWSRYNHELHQPFVLKLSAVKDKNGHKDLVLRCEYDKFR